MRRVAALLGAWCLLAGGPPAVVASTPAELEGVPGLIQRLKSESADVRSRAALELGQLGREAVPAIPALSEAMSDPSEQVARVAGISLGRLAEFSPRAVQELSRGLDDPKTRRNAAYGVLMAGPAAASVVPKIEKQIRSKELPVEDEVVLARCLGRIGPGASGAAGALADLLGSSHPELRREAAWALSRIQAEDPAVVAPLREALVSTDKVLEAAASYALWSMGEMGADAAVGALRELLRSGEERRRCLEALGSLGRAAESAIPDIVTVMKSAGEDGRAAGAEALGAIGVVDDQVLEALVRLLPRIPEIDARIVQSDRIMACLALGQLGPAAARTTPALIPYLGDSHMAIFVEGTLIDFGDAALPYLREALKEERTSGEVRERITSLLENMDGGR